MHLIYNLTTKQIVWRGQQPYDADPTLAPVEPPLVKLVEIQEPQPERGPWDSLTPTEVVDVEAGTLTRGWEVVPGEQPPPTPEEKLAVLNDAFKSAVPPELLGQFGVAFASVRVLVQAGEMELARATVAVINVPPELEGAKQQILEAMQ